MKKSILITLSLFVSWSITTHSLYGGTFGPNEYVRAVGQPTVYTDTFSAAPGSGIITVRNGHWDGSHRVTNAVTSARIVLNEEHLCRILRSYFEYYHDSRTHLSLDRNPPNPREVEPPSHGKVVAIPQVGGLHHRYTRAA